MSMTPEEYRRMKNLKKLNKKKKWNDIEKHGGKNTGMR